jgi:hypothetical protein
MTPVIPGPALYTRSPIFIDHLHLFGRHLADRLTEGHVPQVQSDALLQIIAYHHTVERDVAVAEEAATLLITREGITIWEPH